MTKTVLTARAPKVRTTPSAKPKTTRRSKPAPAAPVAADPAASTGKIAALVALLRQDGGATIAAMMEATGWQAHSVRGAISGSIKKKLGLTVTSTKAETSRVYCIVDGATA